MRDGLLVILVGSILLSCGDGNVRILIDPDIQLAEDSTEIAGYFQAKGYDNFEITDLGVWYTILDMGTGTQIDESDIVTFHYIGMFTTDTIFDTSIKTIGDSIRKVENIPDKFTAAFSPLKKYSPVVISYTTSGWAIRDQFVPGFSDGLTSTFRQMNAGGRAIIAMPSVLGYGGAGSGLLVPPNAVILFELLPTKAVKQ